MIVKSKNNSDVFDVVGYSNSKFLIIYYQVDDVWGGFFWEDKSKFEVLDNNTSHIIKDSLKYHVGRFEKETRYVIPELHLSKLQEISIDSDYAEIFWNEDYLDRKLTAISYVEYALRKYQVRFHEKLKDYISNCFEDKCIFYLKGYIEGILLKGNYAGTFNVEIDWEYKKGNINPEIINQNMEELLFVQKLRGHPDLDDNQISRFVLLHLKALFNFNQITIKIIDKKKDFLDVYLLNAVFISDNKWLEFKIDVSLP
jgi:hypothetical protein